MTEPIAEQPVRPRRYRSLFWPIVLISIGLMVLLGNAGVISAKNVIALLRMWPLLLIIIGLDLMFGRRSAWMGAFIGIGAIVLMVLIMLIGPEIGLAGDWKVKEFNKSHPLAGDEIAAIEEAEIKLELSLGDVEVKTVSSSKNLIETELTYIGEEVAFFDDDFYEGRQTVTLGAEGRSDDWIDFVGWLIAGDDEELNWDIYLNRDVPVELTADFGVGNIDLDLTDMTLLKRLNLDGGLGSINLTLPAAEERYRVTVESALGDLKIHIPDEDTNVELRVDSSLGSATIDVPRDAAVRLEASVSLGSVNVPSHFNEMRDEVWQTDNYDGDGPRIDIHFEGSLGSLNVRD